MKPCEIWKNPQSGNHWKVILTCGDRVVVEHCDSPGRLQVFSRAKIERDGVLWGLAPATTAMDMHAAEEGLRCGPRQGSLT